MQTSLLVLAGLLSFNFVNFAWAESLSGGAVSTLPADEVKLNGLVGLGFSREQDSDVKDQFNLGLQGQSKRHEGFKAVFEFVADEDSRTVSIDDIFVDYQFADKTKRLRFGRGKKIVGFEWEYPTSARLTLKRTANYEFLNGRALTGRDYFVSFVKIVKNESSAGVGVDDGQAVPLDLQVFTDSTYVDPQRLIDPSEDWKFEVAAHFDETNDLALVVSALKNFSNDFRLGAWVTAQRTQSVDQIVGVWDANVSLLYALGMNRAELELMAGTDPYRTEINRIYGDKTIVNFAGIRAEYGLYLARFNPYVSSDILWTNTRELSDKQIDTVVGLRFYVLSNFSVTGEGYATASLAAGDATTSSFHSSGFRTLARYFF